MVPLSSGSKKRHANNLLLLVYMLKVEGTVNPIKKTILCQVAAYQAPLGLLISPEILGCLCLNPGSNQQHRLEWYFSSRCLPT